MEEDLDRKVERCATMLLSDDSADIHAGAEIFRELYRKGELCFARFAQEIAAYKGGMVLKRLWNEVFEFSAHGEAAQKSRSLVHAACHSWT